MNKYYWILVEVYSYEGNYTESFVENKHPFSVMKDRSSNDTLLNWKEITKEEYELYNTIV